MKVFSKMTNIVSVAGVSIRPGENTIGIKKLEAIKKHPKIKKYFSDGVFSDVKIIPKAKKKPAPPPPPSPPPQPPAQPPADIPTPTQPAADAPSSTE